MAERERADEAPYKGSNQHQSAAPEGAEIEVGSGDETHIEGSDTRSAPGGLARPDESVQSDTSDVGDETASEDDRQGDPDPEHGADKVADSGPSDEVEVDPDVDTGQCARVETAEVPDEQVGDDAVGDEPESVGAVAERLAGEREPTELESDSEAGLESDSEAGEVMPAPCDDVAGSEAADTPTALADPIGLAGSAEVAGQAAADQTTVVPGSPALDQTVLVDSDHAETVLVSKTPAEPTAVVSKSSADPTAIVSKSSADPTAVGQTTPVIPNRAASLRVARPTKKHWSGRPVAGGSGQTTIGSTPGPPSQQFPAVSDSEEQQPSRGGFGRTWTGTGTATGNSMAVSLGPVAVTIVALVLLAALGAGVWMIAEALDRAPGQGAGGQSTPSATASVSDEPTEPPSSPQPTVSQSRFQNEQTTVPSVIGMPVSGARAALDTAGLSYWVKYDSDSTAAPGTVIDCDPRPGAVVNYGTQVTLKVSRTPSPMPSPSTSRSLSPSQSTQPSGSASPGTSEQSAGTNRH